MSPPILHLAAPLCWSLLWPSSIDGFTGCTIGVSRRSSQRRCPNLSSSIPLMMMIQNSVSLPPSLFPPPPPPLIHLFFLSPSCLTDPQFGEGGCCGLNKGGHTAAVLLSRVVPTLLLMILYVLDIFQMIVIMTFNVGLLAALLLGAGLGYLVFGSE
jgi:hypothetical protein